MALAHGEHEVDLLSRDFRVFDVEITGQGRSMKAASLEARRVSFDWRLRPERLERLILRT
ncbi:MAG: hypothetical protein R3C97_13280 [Geminicoccaceae bacterium]